MYVDTSIEKSLDDQVAKALESAQVYNLYCQKLTDCVAVVIRSAATSHPLTLPGLTLEKPVSKLKTGVSSPRVVMKLLEFIVS